MFWKWVKRSAYPAKAAREHLRDLTSLGLTAIPAQVLADDALEIALKHRVTADDACYIAAAVQLGLPLITADEKLAGQMTKGSFGEGKSNIGNNAAKSLLSPQGKASALQKQP